MTSIEHSQDLPIEQVMHQQLVDFVETGAYISTEVADHLRTLSPDQLAELDGTVPTQGESIDPNRRQWISNLAIRGSALIDRMAIPDGPHPGGRTDMQEGTLRNGNTTGGRHTRASLGHFLTQELPGKVRKMY